MIKESVASKKIYQLPKVDYKIKLNQNENPYDLPEEIKSKILQEISKQNWNRYPELGSLGLRKKITKELGIDSKSIMVGNGSNEIMLAIMTTLLEPGKKMLTISPTFSLYSHYGQILGAEVETIPLQKDFQFPINELILKSSGKNVALTILCSPNNPTGNGISEDKLIHILKASNGFVLVDEAYFDFSEQDFSNLINQFDNLIITRTFSKACAFSFGRFGYGLANPKFVKEVYKVLLPYNLGGFPEIAASILLENQNLLAPIISEIKEQRDFIYQELNNIEQIAVYPSKANFLLIEPKCESGWLFNELIKKGILVRNVSNYPGLVNHLRISVGKPEENKILIDVLKKIMS
jgi:histidinol-phosphate aminotransferase